MHIKIIWDEWLQLQEYVSSNKKKFLAPFTYLLTLRLQKEGIKCFFKCVYNSFSTSNSENPLNYWKGLYNCTNLNCDLKYEASIKSLNAYEDVIIKLSWQGEPKHEKDSREPRITGN